ncbi:unnamed protein product [Schistosoma mattheei]|uniref:Uncharacterized protein n=1 Tax=Schistosoma mattheei TaxID=31246 RepID=A0A3P8FPQ4_9TREM|nr:unnamed protein product [Schistosoma mattheei]
MVLNELMFRIRENQKADLCHHQYHQISVFLACFLYWKMYDESNDKMVDVYVLVDDRQPEPGQSRSLILTC